MVDEVSVILVGLSINVQHTQKSKYYLSNYKLC